jgi:sec-independent protein translocase protein TatA
MDLGPWEIAIIAVVILVLFGSKKLPDAARSLGRSLRILKTEVKGMHDDDDQPAQPTPATQPPAELPAGQSSVATPPSAPTTTVSGDRQDLR